jgi:hypothetical protein
VIPIHLSCFSSGPCSHSNQQCFRWRVSPSGSSTVPARRRITSNAVYLVLKSRTAFWLYRATAPCDCFDGYENCTEAELTETTNVVTISTSAGVRSRVLFTLVSVRFARGFANPVRHCFKPYSRSMSQVKVFLTDFFDVSIRHPQLDRIVVLLKYRCIVL